MVRLLFKISKIFIKKILLFYFIFFLFVTSCVVEMSSLLTIYSNLVDVLKTLELEDEDIMEIVQLTDTKIEENKKKQNPDIQLATQIEKSFDQLIRNETEYLSTLNTVLDVSTTQTNYSLILYQLFYFLFLFFFFS